MKATAKILLITLILTLLVGSFAGCGETVYTYDYLAEDLSQYVHIAESDYKGYELTVNMGQITDYTVDQQIMHNLYEHRSDKAENPGKTVPLTVGDLLEMCYRGYVKDEDGKEIEVDGFSCMGDETSYKLGIGSASLPLGVESSLIGVVIADYPSLESVSKKTGEVIGATDVVYINYSLLSPEGKSSASGVRVDLTRDDLDATFGAGFREAILGATITEERTISSFTTTTSSGKRVYSDVSIDTVFPKDSKCITVEGVLPYDFDDFDLAGDTIYFDIFPEYFTAYSVPELDDTFILETLKLTAEDLAEYEGDGLVAKYRAYVKAELEKSNEEQLRAIREEAMWYHYNDVATVIALPEDAVLAIYHQDLAEIDLVWQAYKEDYPKLDEFACAYLSLTSGSDWRAKLRDDAEEEVKEKLIFYYIVKREGLLPTEEEYNAHYAEFFAEFVDYYMDGKTAEDYASEDEYNKARAEAEEEVLEFYGDAFFRDQVYYDFAIDALLEFAKLEIGE